MTFCGLRSRWTTPAAWAASSAAHTCRTMASTRGGGHRAAAERLVERAAVDELHREVEELPGHLAVVVDGDAVGVPHRRREPRLLAEPLGELPLRPPAHEQHLHRALGPRVGVARPVHHAHAPLAEARLAAVLPDGEGLHVGLRGRRRARRVGVDGGAVRAEVDAVVGGRSGRPRATASRSGGTTPRSARARRRASARARVGEVPCHTGASGGASRARPRGPPASRGCAGRACGASAGGVYAGGGYAGGAYTGGAYGGGLRGAAAEQQADAHQHRARGGPRRGRARSGGAAATRSCGGAETGGGAREGIGATSTGGTTGGAVGAGRGRAFALGRRCRRGGGGAAAGPGLRPRVRPVAARRAPRGVGVAGGDPPRARPVGRPRRGRRRRRGHPDPSRRARRGRGARHARAAAREGAAPPAARALHGPPAEGGGAARWARAPPSRAARRPRPAAAVGGRLRRTALAPRRAPVVRADAAGAASRRGGSG